MSPIEKLANAALETIRQDLLHAVETLLRAVGSGQGVLDEVREIRELLESLPLATGEYGLACNRLRNAQRYLASTQQGAARYELQLLAGSLKTGQTREVGPRPRVRSN